MTTQQIKQAQEAVQILDNVSATPDVYARMTRIDHIRVHNAVQLLRELFQNEEQKLPPAT